jgi:NAD(P)-dependent dehydrogenase (short-subunit alcohol dehydrogenase family)
VSVAGKVALVTGGASGIGEALVRRLADEGAETVIVDVDEAGARRLAEETGGRAVAANVSRGSDWDEIAAALDRLDLACLNAGVTTGTRSIVDLTDEQYRRILGVNVDGVVFGIRALVPLLERDGGAIAVTASLAAFTAVPDDPLYAATKHFLVGLVRSAAPELERRGVRVNAICPGYTDTPLLGGDERARFDAAGFPLLRAEEVAETAVAALSSDDTGQAWVCQPGRPAERYRFRGVPGPRVAGVPRVLPPVAP